MDKATSMGTNTQGTSRGRDGFSELQHVLQSCTKTQWNDQHLFQRKLLQFMFRKTFLHIVLFPSSISTFLSLLHFFFLHIDSPIPPSILPLLHSLFLLFMHHVLPYACAHVCVCISAGTCVSQWQLWFFKVMEVTCEKWGSKSGAAQDKSHL
jgi:hypothetical protein